MSHPNTSTPFIGSTHRLDDLHSIFYGSLPKDFDISASDFENFWSLHPESFPEILMHGRNVRAPRWQQAFGRDYRFAGKLSRAEPIPEWIAPFLNWARNTIDERLNGILVNWYDGKLRHYIGRHRDSRHGLVVGAPIVTVSLGDERVFRLRRWPQGDIVHEVPLPSGTVVVLPYATNLTWTHEVPHLARNAGRRISLTFRSFHS